MTDSRVPRVLLLTHSKLQPYTGGGVLLNNLFHKFPREKLFFLHSDDNDGGGVVSQEYQLGLRALRPTFIALLRLFGGFLFEAFRAPLSIRRLEIKSLVIQGCHFRISNQLDTQIHLFRPEVIYAWVGDSIWARLLEHCAERYQLPYVIHFMDNHVELSGRTVVERVLSREFRSNLARVTKGASKIFTISAAMGLAYQDKFGKPFDIFHGLINRKSWPWPASAKETGAFSLVFTGSIESGQLSGLRDVADAVERLANEGHSVQLILYLTDHYERRARAAFKRFRCVKYRPHPDFDSLRSALNDADLLVLAYGFEDACVQYYRYSFATKVVPYMLSGRCILAYGPASIEPIAYMQRGGCAHVVCDQDVEVLSESIQLLMNAPGQREQLARSAYDAGVEEHDLESNSGRFVNVLSNVAIAGKYIADIESRLEKKRD